MNTRIGVGGSEETAARTSSASFAERHDTHPFPPPPGRGGAGLRVCLLATVALLVAGAASATCPVSVNASVGNETFTITASTSGACGASTLTVYIDGHWFASRSCDGPACTLSETKSTACRFSTGTHIVEAFADCHRNRTNSDGTVSCVPDEMGGARTTFSIDSTPKVSVSYVPLDEEGRGEVHVAYSFPHTVYASDRLLSVLVDGTWRLGTQPEQQSGVWIARLDRTCWRTGPHTIKATAHACNRHLDPTTFTEAETIVTVNSTPTVQASFAAGPPDGKGTISVAYGFPNTASNWERFFSVYVDGAFWRQTAPLDMYGTWSDEIDTACLKGMHTIVVNALACNQHLEPLFHARDETQFSSDSPPKVSLTLRKLPGSGPTRLVEGTLDYDMGEGRDWRLQAFVLSGTTADGRPYDGYRVHHDPAVTGPPVGSQTFTFLAPASALQLLVRGTAETCQDIADDVAGIELSCELSSEDPVNFVDGNVQVTDGDPLPPIGAQSLVRTYHSDEQIVALFGRGWTTLFDQRLIRAGSGAGEVLAVVTATNEVAVFRRVAGALRQTWPESREAPGTLVEDAAGAFAYRAPGSSEVLVFRGTDGRLAAIRDASTGRQAEVSYDQSGLPRSLTDSWSELGWNLTTDPVGRRVSSISVTGHPDIVWSYEYDADGNLLSVRAPGGAKWRSYEYAANRMTASRDGAGNLIESHTYDANGYGTSSTGPNDEISAIEYGLSGSVPGESVTRVTYKTGATAEYALRRSGGGYRPIRVTGGCASCGKHDATYVRDARGRVIREQDARGYITVSAYDPVTHTLATRTVFLRPSTCDPETDPVRCRMTSEELAEVGVLATRSTVTTHYEYGDANWPERPTTIRTVSLIDVLSRRHDDFDRMSTEDDEQWRRETFAYDPTTGILLAHAISGWSGGSHETRTSSTTLYDGIEPAAFAPGGPFETAWLSLAQPQGLRKSADGPRTDAADVTLFVYYPLDQSVPAELRGRLAATKNAAGHTVRYEAYDAFGNFTRSSDANGVVTESTYDALGRRTGTTLKGVSGCDTAADALCSTDLGQTWSYSGAGPLETETRAGGGVTAYTYDSRGRVKTISRGPAAADLRERIEHSYDAATGKKSLTRILAWENGGWVEKQRESFTYDADGLLQRLTHADGTFVEYGYDSAQQLVSVRDENHAGGLQPNTRYAYDPAGRLARVTQTLSTAPEGAVTTTYGYDARGNLSGVTDPNGNTTSYLYDDFDQVMFTTSPVTGTTSYAYDEAGQLISTTDANGATTLRTYDALGRVLTATATRPGAPAEVVTWTYDAPAAGRFAVGRFSSMSDPAGSTAYAYERRGLLREETRTFPSTTSSYTTTFRYDRDGNRRSIGYPSSSLTVDYTFDYAGRPKSASGFVLGAEYLPYGPLTRLQLANGTTQSFEYDARYRVTKNSLNVNGLAGPAGTLARYNYEYDPAGNVTAILDTLDAEYHRHFGYDQLHRLILANTGPDRSSPRTGGTVLWGKGTYTWDAMGNLLALKLGEIEKTSDPDPLMARRPRRPPDTAATVPLGRAVELRYDGTTPRLVAVTNDSLSHTVTSDAAGNETAYFVSRTYSPRNLLERVTDSSGEESEPHSVAYHYDGRGLRVIRSESPVAGPGTSARRYYTYAPELRLLSVTADDIPNVWESHHTATEIVWFGDRPVAQLSPAAPTRYTFADHLGTPILQTDSTAAIVWRVEYEPFGNVYAVRAGHRTDQPLRFPGQELATTWEGPEESYNVFRWYRSGWGRYTQADPLGQRGDPHPFLYAAANPVRFVDPTGERSRVCCTPVVGWGPLSYFSHCFIQMIDDDTGVSRTFSLHNMGGGWGCTFKDDGFDTKAAANPLTPCGPWNEDCGTDGCVAAAHEVYPKSTSYSYLGPNSNTYASTIASQCGLTPPTVPLSGGGAPGWGQAPAPPFAGKTCPTSR